MKAAYWKPLNNPDSIKAYANDANTFIRTILRHYDGFAGVLNYVIPLTEHQNNNARALLVNLRRGVEDFETMQSLHNFLYALFEVQDRRIDALEHCPFSRYLTLRALRDDGGFIPPEHTTGIFAKIKYFANCVAIMDADTNKHKYADGMVSSVSLFKIYLTSTNLLLGLLLPHTTLFSRGVVHVSSELWSTCRLWPPRLHSRLPSLLVSSGARIMTGWPLMARRCPCKHFVVA